MATPALDFEVVDLPPDQWHILQDAFDSQQSSLPNPQVAGIRVAIVKNTNPIQIAGFVVLQKALMAQPVLVYPQFMHQHIWAKLYDSIDAELLPGMFYFVTIKEPALMRQAEHRGFVNTGATMLVKVKAKE